MTLARAYRFARRVMTDWTLWRARRRVHRECPEIAAIPPRDEKGRFQSVTARRRAALHNRLRQEVGHA